MIFARMSSWTNWKPTQSCLQSSIWVCLKLHELIWQPSSAAKAKEEAYGSSKCKSHRNTHTHTHNIVGTAKSPIYAEERLFPPCQTSFPFLPLVSNCTIFLFPKSAAQQLFPEWPLVLHPSPDCQATAASASAAPAIQESSMRVDHDWEYWDFNH